MKSKIPPDNRYPMPTIKTIEDLLGKARAAQLAAEQSSMTPTPTGVAPSGRLRRPLRGILFDVYGTLLISRAGDISLARQTLPASGQFRTLLSRYDITEDPEQILTRYVAAVTQDHAAARRAGVDWPEIHVETIWAKVIGTVSRMTAMRFALEFELLANPVCLMPHLTAMLSACRHAGLMLGIISNAQFYTPLLLRWLTGTSLQGLGFSPELLFYSYAMGRAKPSEILYAAAVRALAQRHIPPSAVLYVGNDVAKDILPAATAGFQTALFAGDARSLRLDGRDPASLPAPADLVVTDLRGLSEKVQAATGNNAQAKKGFSR